MIRNATRNLNKAGLLQNLKEEALRIYEAKEAEFPEPEQIREIERVILIESNRPATGWTISMIWISFVRESVFRRYGQRDPVTEYQIPGL